MAFTPTPLPFQWGQYQQPSVSQDQYAFFRPSNSTMPSGQAQLSYLTPGTDSQETRRTVKFDGGLTREAIGNSTNFLNNQMGSGFGQLNTNLQTGFGQQMSGFEDLLNRFGGLGGLGGMQSGSPVYRPGGQTVDQTAQQGTNGQPLPWNAANPFAPKF